MWDCPPLAESNFEGWRGLLDELDRQLLRANRPIALATHASGIWDIAELRQSFEPLGPMPSELVDRARGIEDKYRVTIAGMQDARRRVGEHLSILQSIRQVQARAPIYLDQMG
ncbi:MAG: hypothetical protein QOK08_68 [Actinomycetota bacterium]|jgi:hypothetical protein|nr:hypothetical protein [Actinomycetota bacterium]